MSTNTFMGAKWEEKDWLKKKSDDFIEDFISLLSFFENPYVSELEFGWRDAIKEKSYKLKKQKKNRKGLSLQEIKKELAKALKQNRDATLEWISCCGVFFFDHEKYASGFERITIDRKGLYWRGLNPEFYINWGTLKERESFEARGGPSLQEKERIIHNTSKKIIQTFNPAAYFFSPEADYFHHSTILYYKNLYLFCIQLSFDNDNLDSDTKIKRKLAEVVSVITEQEISAVITDYATIGEYEVLRNKDGGLGVFEKFVKSGKTKESLKGFPLAIRKLRNIVRAKGVELPQGDVDEE